MRNSDHCFGRQSDLSFENHKLQAVPDCDVRRRTPDVGRMRLPIETSSYPAPKIQTAMQNAMTYCMLLQFTAPKHLSAAEQLATDAHQTI